jgi:hypothetical protein
MNENPTMQKIAGPIRGYKAFKRDGKKMYTDGNGNAENLYWTVGEGKELEQLPVMCENGFHFFRHLCFAIDYLENGNAICEIEASGDILEDSHKLITNKIKIIRVVSKKEISKTVDKKNNAGGDRNSGDRNSGNGYRNYFCTRTRYFLFDEEVEKIPDEIKNLDFSWFFLEKEDNAYKNAWSKCPVEIIKKIMSIKEFDKKKFYEITGIDTDNIKG